MPALGYKKSRTGCVRCKQRRVKCDEKRPCTACVRHNVECTLVTAVARQTHSPSGASSQGEDQPLQSQRMPKQAVAGVRRTTPKVVPILPRSQGEQPHSSDPYPYFARFTTHTGELLDSNPGSCMIDLELMHHWSTHTHKSLPRAEDANSVWQYLVPRMAFRHQFLMSQLLATSAFHLAYLNPAQHHIYSLRASQHQDNTVSLMRKELSDVTLQNCDALFATSLLLLFGGFAGGTNQSNLSALSVEDLLDVFLLTRGINTVLKSANEAIETGTMKDFFAPPRSPPPPMPATLQALIEKVEGLGHRLKANQPEDRELAVVEAEIGSLITCIQHAHATTPKPEARMMATWPIFLSTEYIGLVRQRHPAAMVLLMHYCVLLCMGEESFWYVRGWALGVARAIQNAIDPSWNDVVEWPMGFITARSTPRH